MAGKESCEPWAHTAPQPRPVPLCRSVFHVRHLSISCIHHPHRHTAHHAVSQHPLSSTSLPSLWALIRHDSSKWQMPFFFQCIHELQLSNGTHPFPVTSHLCVLFKWERRSQAALCPR